MRGNSSSRLLDYMNDHKLLKNNSQRKVWLFLSEECLLAFLEVLEDRRVSVKFEFANLVFLTRFED